MIDVRRVVLFGAAMGGRYVLGRLDRNMRVVGVVDSDPGKHGDHVCGHPVMSPARISDMEFDSVIVSTSRFEEVVSFLAEHGIPMDRVERGITSPEYHPAPPAPGGDSSERYCPLVSIIMPAYNREDCIGRAILSVLAQSYENWELLIIDDGSEDATSRIASAFANQDARIRVLSETHQGAGAARNKGLCAASGEVVAYLDTDNRWHPDYLVCMVTRFSDGRYSCGYAGMNIIHERENAAFLWAPGYDRGRLEEMNYIDLNVFMHRREMVEACGYFDEKLTRLIDWDFVLRYTRDDSPFFLKAVLADYFSGNERQRISTAESFDGNYDRISARHCLNGEWLTKENKIIG